MREKINYLGYENIGWFATKIIDYHNPQNQKEITLDVFIEKRTNEIFFGDKKPQLKLEAFIRSIGKIPKINYYSEVEI